MSNKKAKEKLIKLYGAECFIDKLHLRNDGVRTYTGIGQKKKMKALTYHHIIKKSDGGKANQYNGAILSVENHIWFHQQPESEQNRMNNAFQRYKKCSVTFVDELETGFEVKCAEIKINKRGELNKGYNRHKEKIYAKRFIEESLDEMEDER